MPEIRNIDIVKRQTSSKEMSIDEIETFMFQLEAERKQETKEGPSAKRVEQTKTKQQQQEHRCHRCNKLGHWANECRLKDKNLWFCCYCQGIQR